MRLSSYGVGFANSKADDQGTLQHRTENTLWALALLATLVVASATVNWVYHGRVVAELEELDEQENPKVLTTTWISGGKERSWTSTREEGEELDDLADRHDKELTVLLRKYPQDATPDEK